MIIFICTVLLAVGVSFVCSLLESSVLSLGPADIARLRQRDAALGARWERLRSNIGQPIAVILILNTAAAVVGATIAGVQFSELFGSRWLPLFSIGFSLLIIQWAELLPKTLGVRHRVFVATHVGRPLSGAIAALRPLVWLTRQLNRPFEDATAEGSSTVDEIRQLARYATVARLLDPKQEKLITKSIAINELPVDRIMVPRAQVDALEEQATVAELLAVVSQHGYSRIPIYRERIDDVVGIVLVKDVLIALGDGSLAAADFERRSASEFMTEPVFVPASASVGRMMGKATEGKAHMVIALDEHGGFAGIATLEDALEELVGEILDEHDEADAMMIERVSPRRWIAAGLCPLGDLATAVGIEISAKEQRYTTLSGLLMWLSGNVPKVGDVIRTESLRFRVLEASPTVPRKVEITRLQVGAGIAARDGRHTVGDGSPRQPDPR